MLKTIFTSLLLIFFYVNTVQTQNRVKYLPEEIVSKSFRCKYTYDKLNRKVKEEVSLIYGENLHSTYTLSYTYNENGTIKTTTNTHYLIQDNQKQDTIIYSYTEYYQYQSLSDTLIIANINHKLTYQDGEEVSDSTQAISKYYINNKGLLYKQVYESQTKNAQLEFEYNSNQQPISYMNKIKEGDIIYYEQKYESLASDKKNGIFKDVNINWEQPNFQTATYFMLYTSDSPTLMTLTTSTRIPYNLTGSPDLDYEIISKTSGLYYIYNEDGYPIEIEVYEMDDDGNKDILRDKLSIKYIKLD